MGLEEHRKGFTRRDYEAFKEKPNLIIVYYDEIPKTEFLREALENGLVRVEFDYDRTGWSKTGWVYRAKGKDAP